MTLRTQSAVTALVFVLGGCGSRESDRRRTGGSASSQVTNSDETSNISVSGAKQSKLRMLGEPLPKQCVWLEQYEQWILDPASVNASPISVSSCVGLFQGVDRLDRPSVQEPYNFGSTTHDNCLAKCDELKDKLGTPPIGECSQLVHVEYEVGIGCVWENFRSADSKTCGCTEPSPVPVPATPSPTPSPAPTTTTPPPFCRLNLNQLRDRPWPAFPACPTRAHPHGEVIKLKAGDTDGACHIHAQRLWKECVGSDLEAVMDQNPGIFLPVVRTEFWKLKPINPDISVPDSMLHYPMQTHSNGLPIERDEVPGDLPLYEGEFRAVANGEVKGQYDPDPTTEAFIDGDLMPRYWKFIEDLRRMASVRTLRAAFTGDDIKLRRMLRYWFLALHAEGGRLRTGVIGVGPQFIGLIPASGTYYSDGVRNRLDFTIELSQTWLDQLKARPACRFSDLVGLYVLREYWKSLPLSQMTSSTQLQQMVAVAGTLLESKTYPSYQANVKAAADLDEHMASLAQNLRFGELNTAYAPGTDLVSKVLWIPYATPWLASWIREYPVGVALIPVVGSIVGLMENLANLAEGRDEAGRPISVSGESILAFINTISATNEFMAARALSGRFKTFAENMRDLSRSLAASYDRGQLLNFIRRAEVELDRLAFAGAPMQRFRGKRILIGSDVPGDNHIELWATAMAADDERRAVATAFAQGDQAWFRSPWILKAHGPNGYISSPLGVAIGKNMIDDPKTVAKYLMAQGVGLDGAPLIVDSCNAAASYNRQFWQKVADEIGILVIARDSVTVNSLRGLEDAIAKGISPWKNGSTWGFRPDPTRKNLIEASRYFDPLRGSEVKVMEYGWKTPPLKNPLESSTSRVGWTFIEPAQVIKDRRVSAIKALVLPPAAPLRVQQQKANN